MPGPPRATTIVRVRRHVLGLVLVAATLASPAGVGGCSWLLGVSEDPVVADLSADAADAEPDARPSGGDSAGRDSPDVAEAAAADAQAD